MAIAHRRRRRHRSFRSFRVGPRLIIVAIKYCSGSIDLLWRRSLAPEQPFNPELRSIETILPAIASETRGRRSNSRIVWIATGTNHDPRLSCQAARSFDRPAGVELDPRLAKT